MRKDLFNNKATISLNVSDIFNTRKFKITTEDPRFTQYREFQRESRIGTLSFTYRFGGFKEKGAERSRREGGDDMGDDF